MKKSNDSDQTLLDELEKRIEELEKILKKKGR